VTSTQLSLGGLAVAGTILILCGIRWWRTGFPTTTALFFTAGLLFGIAGALCGGLLGWTSHHLAAAAGRIGDRASGTHQLLPHAGSAGLAVGGGVAILAATVAIGVLWCLADERLRRPLFLGGLAGICLGMAGGIAGLAATTLVPALNHGGDQILAAFH
jgi:hypothetical protein